MKQFVIYILLFLCLLSSVAVIYSYFRNRRYKLLVSVLQNKEYEKLDYLLDTKITKFFFAPSSLEFLRLNSAIMRNDKELIRQSFNNFENHKLNREQEEEVYSRGFNFFISEKDYDTAKKYLDKINTLDNEKLKREADCMYDVYALKGHKYLVDLLKETDGLEDKYKGMNEYIISLMYQNMGEKDKSEEYLKQSKKHMKMLDEHIVKTTK